MQNIRKSDKIGSGIFYGADYAECLYCLHDTLLRRTQAFHLFQSLTRLILPEVIGRSATVEKSYAVWWPAAAVALSVNLPMKRNERWRGRLRGKKHWVGEGL